MIKKIPQQMKEKKNWVNYKIEDNNGKKTKIPKQPANLNFNASVTNKHHWTNYEQAVSNIGCPSCDGIGFVFDKSGIVGIDLDNAVDERGVIRKWAEEIIHKFENVSYIEISPSKKGYHIITLGNLPDNVKHKSNHDIDKNSLVEIYDNARFFTVTGDVVENNKEITNGQSEIDWFLKKFKMLKINDLKNLDSSINKKNLMQDNNVDLVKTIRSSTSKDKFNMLYSGDISNYDNDISRADMAFCTIIASFTDDSTQIDQIYRESSLYRTKWDEKRGNETYGEKTIKQAFEYANKNQKIREDRTMDSNNFIKKDGTLYYLETKGNKTNEIKICENFDIIAHVRDGESGSWGMYVKWKDRDGKQHYDVIYNNEISDNMYKWWTRIVSNGLIRYSSNVGKKYLTQYLEEYNTDKRYTLVKKTGWKGKSYVMPDYVINNDADRDYLLIPSIKNERFFEKNGTLESWKEMSSYCCNNSRLIMSCCAGFAAPLLGIANMHNAGVHLFGSCSSGKSTTQIVANSIYRSREGISSWRATDNGLENIACARSDSLLVLDEISQASPKDISEIVYMIGNGTGKIRSTKDIVLAETKTWNTFLFSSGEHTVSSMIEKNGGKINAGQEVRLIDVPADAGSGMGIFEDIHHFKSPGEFADALKTLANDNYGYAGKVYLEHLCENYDRVKYDITKFINKFVNEHPEIQDSSQLQRIAKTFGIMRYAGELAIEAGLMDMTTEDVKEAIDKCFAAFLDNRDNMNNSEGVDIVEHVKMIIEKNSYGKFMNLKSNSEERIYNLMGYYELNKDDEREYYFSSAQLKELGRGFNFKIFKETLISAGMLKEKTEKKTLPEGRRATLHKIVVAE